MNEPSIFACPFKEDAPTPQHPMPLATPQGEGEERTVHAEVHNLYGLLMSQASYEGLTRLRLERRPWVLTRSAYTGIQKYAATWMGDNSSWWEHLELSLTQLMSMGLCGIPYAGVDIGGFFENAHAELYARWIEVGAFYPFMRTHTSAGSREQEPWSFGPEVERIVRGSIELRYRLLPYLYTLAYQAYECGAPLMRPLVYDFPDDAESYHLEDQFMLGPQLLIAPALKPGQTHRLVYLPEGIWNSFLTGKRVPSGYSVTETPLGRAPIFVCGGAVLTLGNVRQSTDEPLRELSLRLYPAAESAWTFIEDDGYSPAPEVARTEVQLIETETAVTARLLPREGDYTPPPRTLYLLLHLSRKPSMVTLDGRPQTAWRWDTEGQAVLLHWEDDGAAHELDVELVD